jgi:predicted GH43/DUF377 family glycosyl hydrolase
MDKIRIFFVFLLMLAAGTTAFAQKQKMMFGDTTGRGLPYSKDPIVLNFKGKYWMYFSIRKQATADRPMSGWAIGIAQSTDLINWKKVGEINAEADYEKQGLCAPGGIVKDGKIHLFYQTYGNAEKDAICHATSEDGFTFKRNSTNPIFRPTGSWTNGRAIDAEIVPFKGKYLLYFASRDPKGKVQFQGVASAPGNTDFKRSDWTQLSDHPILKPEYAWEGDCVEGASIIERNGKLLMFYAGNYNNKPQQIGLASSKDGVTWKRVFDLPFLANGKPGEWNSSESGHPCIFKDKDGRTYLFFQGNPDNGKTWLISNYEIGWKKNIPYIIK